MNKNSMFYWWPLVKDLPIPKPKTVLIRHEGAFQGKLSYDPIDGKPDPYFDEMIDKAIQVADAMGYPVFMRTDQYSGKHSWKDTCYVEKREQIRPHACRLLEETAMAFGLGFMGLAIREFLELDWKFKSHGGEMPVAAERRYFVKEGTLLCRHPYWPPASIVRPTLPNWRDVLKNLQTETPVEKEVLKEYSKKIGRTIGGFWSVDFCRTKRGIWYLTDMAVGEDSYHWGTCPHAPPEMLKHYGDPEGEIN